MSSFLRAAASGTTGKAATWLATNRNALLLIGACWLIGCVPGIVYGIPQQFDPSERLFVVGAGRMLVPNYLDPEWYGAPASTLMNLMAPLFASWIALGMLLGTIDDPMASFAGNMHEYIVIGRVVTTLSFLMTGIVFHTYVRRFMGIGASLAATSSLMLAPAMVNFGQITRMDMLMVLFVLLVLHLSGLIARGGGRAAFVLAGMALGAAVMSKYPGIVSVVAILAATFWAWRQGHLEPTAALGSLALAGVASILTAVLLGPYAFINFSDTLSHVLHEARESHLSYTGGGFFAGLSYYITDAIPENSGLFAAMAGVTGLLIALVTRPRVEVVLIGLFGMSFLAFISALSLQWARWALPLAPIVAVGVGLLADRLAVLTARRQWLQLAAVTSFALLVVMPSAAVSVKTTWLKALDIDTRADATAWVHDHLPPGTVIAIETYAPQLSSQDYRVLVPTTEGLQTIAEVWPGRHRPAAFFYSFGSQLRDMDLAQIFTPVVPYVILSDWDERFLAEQASYPREYAVYQWLRQNYKVLCRFEPGPARLGPPITVLSRRDAEPAIGSVRIQSGTPPSAQP